MTFCLADLFCFNFHFYDPALFIYFPLLILCPFYSYYKLFTANPLQMGAGTSSEKNKKQNDSTTSIGLVDNISKSTLISH